MRKLKILNFIILIILILSFVSCKRQMSISITASKDTTLPSTTVIVATAPGAPIIGTATVGNAQANISFSEPASNGGAAITSYTVTSNPDSFTASGAASPLTVTGLTNGTAYTFTVTATNSVGTSSASVASNSVTYAAPSLSVSTLAGSTVGNVDGTGGAAKFNSPSAVTIDGLGNIYVADSVNYSIRKITPAGVVTTMVLSAGDMNGSTFTSYPAGVAFDSAGNLFVSDQYYHLIKKITSLGVMTSFAGTGSWVGGNIDGTGAAALFNGPSASAVDSSNNIFIADTFNNSIRKITPAGVVTTFATGFVQPHGIAIDSSDNLYVADTYNFLIKKITSGGVVTTLAGGGVGTGTVNGNGSSNGTGTAASFDSPRGVAVDSSGNVYVADTVNNLIRKITPAGVVTTVAGTGAVGAANGNATTATFNGPTAIAVDNAGKIYIADEGNHLIRVIQ